MRERERKGEEEMEIMVYTVRLVASFLIFFSLFSSILLIKMLNKKGPKYDSTVCLRLCPWVAGNGVSSYYQYFGINTFTILGENKKYGERNLAK